jgi:hypothetical protein
VFDADVDGGPVAWLHDEIVIEVREDQAQRAAEILKQSMIDGFAETFPGAPLDGLVEPHIGASWGEAKSGATPFDIAARYTERLKRSGLDANNEEVRLRAREFTVLAYQAHHHCSLEDAKAAVLAAIDARTTRAAP